jgi:hypothetical protein
MKKQHARRYQVSACPPSGEACRYSLSNLCHDLSSLFEILFSVNLGHTGITVPGTVRAASIPYFFRTAVALLRVWRRP